VVPAHLHAHRAGHAHWHGGPHGDANPDTDRYDNAVSFGDTDSHTVTNINAYSVSVTDANVHACCYGDRYYYRHPVSVYAGYLDNQLGARARVRVFQGASSGDHIATSTVV
jgi:hypothetical protein